MIAAASWIAAVLCRLGMARRYPKLLSCSRSPLLCHSFTAGMRPWVVRGCHEKKKDMAGRGQQAMRWEWDCPASEGGTGLFPLPTTLKTRRPSEDGAPIAVILRLAGGQSAALIVGQEPGIASGIAWRISGPTAQPQCSLGHRPRTFANEASQAVGLAQCVERDLLRAFSPMPLWLKDLGRCPRLQCGRAVGAESLSPTGRFIGSLRRNLTRRPRR